MPGLDVPTPTGQPTDEPHVATLHCTKNRECAAHEVCEHGVCSPETKEDDGAEDGGAARGTGGGSSVRGCGSSAGSSRGGGSSSNSRGGSSGRGGGEEEEEERELAVTGSLFHADMGTPVKAVLCAVVVLCALVTFRAFLRRLVCCGKEARALQAPAAGGYSATL